MRYLLLLVCFAWACKPVAEQSEVNKRKPNIIILYVDDLGYADVGCYGAKGVNTPHIDSLAKNGMRFTDAHSAAATCTPSRYSLLTGQYAFRNKAAILPGDAPLLINPEKQTLPKMLKSAGYKTGVIGKWHLGLGYGRINWNKKITPGANEVGFDYSFLIPATGDRVPTIYLENGAVANGNSKDPIRVDYNNPVGNEPTGLRNPELLKMKADRQHSKTIVNGVSRIGYMDGGDSARWIDEEFPFILTEKATDFMESSEEEPFFLYYSFHDIHVPRVPNEQFVGKSSMGPRGDAIAQVDWVVGKIVAYLKAHDQLENTLIVFTSDNGPVLDDGYSDRAVEMLGDHNPSGPFRGGKYSIFEAGTRVPTITYWPGMIQSGTSDALLTQTDLLASLADLVREKIQPTDSENHLEAWLGKSQEGRVLMLEEGFTLALRAKNWKYIQPHTGAIPDWMANKDVESGLQESAQLYNLEEDINERQNLADSLPEKLNTLKIKLNKIIKNE